MSSLPDSFAPGPRLRRALAFAALVVVLLASLRKILALCDFHLAGLHLTRSLAVIYGVNPYASATQGPALAGLYPPLSIPFYVPAATLQHPFWSLFVGNLTGFLCCLAPVAFLLFRKKNRAAGLADKILVLSFCLALLLFFNDTKMACFAVMPDNQAIMFAGLALIAAASRSPRASGALAPVLAGLALFCKQTAGPVILPVLLATWFLHGHRKAFFGFAVFVGTTALLFLISVWMFGYERCMFSFFELPFSMPYSFGTNASLSTKALCMLEKVYDWAQTHLVVIALSLVFLPLAPKRAGFLPMLLLASGLFFLPFAALGSLRQCGGDNQFALSTVLLILSLACVFPGILNRLPSRTGPIALVAFIALVSTTQILGLRQSLSIPTHGEFVRGYELCQKHPGEVFLAHHGFALSLERKKIYHCLQEATSWWEATGHKMSDEHFRAWMPTKLKYVGFGGADPMWYPQVADRFGPVWEKRKDDGYQIWRVDGYHNAVGE